MVTTWTLILGSLACTNLDRVAANDMGHRISCGAPHVCFYTMLYLCEPPPDLLGADYICIDSDKNTGAVSWSQHHMCLLIQANPTSFSGASEPGSRAPDGYHMIVSALSTLVFSGDSANANVGRVGTQKEVEAC